MTMFKNQVPRTEGCGPIAQGTGELGDSRLASTEGYVNLAARVLPHDVEFAMPVISDPAQLAAMNARIEETLRGVKVAAGNRVA